MEPRDLVGSVRPKEVALEGGRESNEEDQEVAGLDLAQGDDVIDHVLRERWGVPGEGEGLEEQGEGLEEQEFSIKEASFQEGSLKLKIQTTKRTKKPPKSLENYICPPEIRMTGERGARGGRGCCRGAPEEERGPPRKRTYERQFKAAEQREGGLLQLLGDHPPPKLALTQPHLHTPTWDLLSTGPANEVDTESAREQAATNRSPLVDPIQPYSQRGPEESPFPERSLTPDPQLPVVTDASILNLTSLSRGRGLQEVSEQLFGNIKRKYGRKDSQRTLGSTHNAEVWGKQPEMGTEGLQPAEERQRSRRDETPHLLPEERDERGSTGRRGEEDDREMPMLTEEGKGKKRRRRSFQESYSLEDQSALPQDSDITEIGHPGPSEPKLTPKMAANKRDSGLGKRVEVDSERAGRGEKSDRSERGERERVEPGVSQSRVRNNLVGRSRTSTEPNPNPTLLSPNPIASPSPRPRPNLSPSPRPRPNLNPSPRPRPSLSPSPRPNLSPRPKPNVSPNPRPRPNLSPSPRPRPNLSPSPRPRPNLSPSPRPRPNLSPSPRPNLSPSPSPRPRPNLSPCPNPRARPNLSPSPRPRPNLSPSPRARPNLSPSSRSNHSPNPSPRPNLSPSPSPRSTLNSIPMSMPSPSPRPTKTKDRWSYLKAKSPPSLSPRDSCAPSMAASDPPSAFPITPSSPLYTNTDSLTVHAPPKRKRGRPKKQPLLTVETIHEGTSTCPPSPPATHSSAGLGRGRKTHALASLAQFASPPCGANDNGLRLPRGRGGRPRPVKRLKLGKVQSILNEILSGSAHNGSLALKSSSSTPVTSAMTAVASSIEARLGKQINVSKRGTIYIGKKRGRKPRAQTQANPPRAGFYDGHFVPSNPPPPPPPPPPPGCAPPSLRPGLYEASMPSLQPVSALPSKPSGRGSLQAGGWKLSPPRLLANSPSHLSEGASVKEVTLSPISESHSEETIPSDSGIGTDNNSTSDQTEKGPASRRRYSFDLCGLDAAEAAVLEASSRGRCERQVAVVDSFLSQQDKKQKHHRRKRKCLQSRDHMHFLSELEEVVLKLQQLRVSHRRSSCYTQQPYPSIFRLNFHHYYPLTFHPYACDSAPYLRRSAQLKAKRRRGRPAKTSQPIPAKLPLVQGYGYPLAGGNYYAAPYAMPYPPPLSLGYYPPAPPLYLPPHHLGPAPPSPFMRPAGPPPKAFHSGGHAKLQTGAKLRASSGPLQGLSGRAEGRGPLGGGGGGGGGGSGRGGGLGGVRLHKRKHKHKHKHKDEALLSARDRQELGGLFSGSLLSDRREMTGQGGEKQRGAPRGQRAALSSLSLVDAHFHSRQPGQPMSGFLSGYRGQSQRASELFSESREEASSGRSRRRGLPVFGEEGMMSFQNARKEESLMSDCPSLTGKRRYKRREVEEIQKEVRRNFDHVQKILRVKRLQRQAKTGNNVVKRRPGRPRKRPLEEPELTNHRAEDRAERRGDGRSLGMPVLERCVDLPGRRSMRPSPAPQPLEFSNHDSISAAIETVVHRARSVAPTLAGGGKRRGRRREELWTPNSQ